MLIENLKKCSLKGPDATEPFIYHDSQGILIAGRLRLPPNLLRGHIRGRAAEALRADGTSNGRSQRNPKVAEQHLAL
jgi:hypothetical protein